MTDSRAVALQGLGYGPLLAALQGLLGVQQPQPPDDPLWLPMFGSNLRKQKRAQMLRRRKDEEELLLFFQN